MADVHAQQRTILGAATAAVAFCAWKLRIMMKATLAETGAELEGTGGRARGGHGISVYGEAVQPATLSAAFVRASLRHVFEFWEQHGIDTEHGGFWDGVAIEPGYRPSPASQKSEFAQGRQVYAYCLAAQMFPPQAAQRMVGQREKPVSGQTRKS